MLLRHHKGKRRNLQEHHRKTSKHRVSLARKSRAVVFCAFFLPQLLMQEHVRCSEWTSSIVLYWDTQAEVWFTKGCHKLKEPFDYYFHQGCVREPEAATQGEEETPKTHIFLLDCSVNWEGKQSFGTYFPWHSLSLPSSHLPLSLASTTRLSKQANSFPGLLSISTCTQ